MGLLDYPGAPTIMGPRRTIVAWQDGWGFTVTHREDPDGAWQVQKFAPTAEHLTWQVTYRAQYFPRAGMPATKMGYGASYDAAIANADPIVYV